MIKMRSLLAWRFKDRIKYFFAKNQNNKQQTEINQNYTNSRKIITKPLPKNNQNIFDQLKQISNHSVLQLKYLMMINLCLLGGIPFWSPINIGIALVNGGYILNSLGLQFKRYLLLINNNQLQSISEFRTPKKYFILIFQNSIILSILSIFLSSGFYGCSNLITIIWILIGIKEKLLSPQFLMLLIPILISVAVNFYSKDIKQFLLKSSQNQTKK